jgi:hypothetical protein
MDESTASSKADQALALILQRQESLFGSKPFESEEKAREAAKHIAAFRLALIAELEDQPD